MHKHGVIMNWMKDIYQVVRAAYLEGEGSQPSASWLPPTLPPSAMNIPHLTVKDSLSPTEQRIQANIDDYSEAYKQPFRDTKKTVDSWMGALVQLPVGILRSAYKQQLARTVAPFKQGKVKLLRMTEDRAYKAGRTKEDLFDRYTDTKNPAYKEKADFYAKIEHSAIEDIRRQKRSIAGTVTGMRKTSKALDRIPQIAMDDIKSVGLSLDPFMSQATRTTIGLAPIHMTEAMDGVVAHETIHSAERSGKIVSGDQEVNKKGMELFKRLRTSDSKTRIIDAYLARPEFVDLTDAKTSELLVAGKIPTRFAQGLSSGIGYKNNPMEMHANLMGGEIAKGKVDKTNFAEKFMSAMQQSLNYSEADVDQMFELMADRMPNMRGELKLREIVQNQDYSYQIKHDDPSVQKAIKAITRQVDQGGGLFGDMIYFRGQGKNVETRMGAEGLQMRQYGEEWQTQDPTHIELNPRSNRIGEPIGDSVTGNPNIAYDFRERNAPRENTLPHMQTRQIEAKIDNYKRVISKLGDRPVDYEHISGRLMQPEEAKKQLTKEMGFYEAEYKRRTDPRSIERVRLNLEGDADKTLVKPFEERGAKDLVDTYTEAMVDELAKIYKSKKSLANEAVDLIEQKNTHYELYEEIERTINKNVFGAENFNLNQTARLQELGYKGIAHSPSRYDEFEVRIFEPEDVYALDVRKWSKDQPEKGDPAIERLMEQSQQGRLDVWEETAQAYGKDQGSLRNLYKNIDLRDVIYRAIKRAYGQETE